MVVASPAFAKAWRDSNRAAHKQIVGALAGESDSVGRATGSTVELRLGPLAAAVREEVDKAGLPLSVAIPRTDTTYPIGDTEDLARAKTAYNLLNDYGRALPVGRRRCCSLLGLVLARQRGPALSLRRGRRRWSGSGCSGSASASAGRPTSTSCRRRCPTAAGRAYFDILTAGLAHARSATSPPAAAVAARARLSSAAVGGPSLADRPCRVALRCGGGTG